MEGRGDGKNTSRAPKSEELSLSPGEPRDLGISSKGKRTAYRRKIIASSTVRRKEEEEGKPWTKRGKWRNEGTRRHLFRIGKLDISTSE